MKRIFTIIFALMAIALGTNAADTRTEITLVEATSADYATIPVVGASVMAKPTVQITTGAPAYFHRPAAGWRKKTGANSSSQVKEGLFTEGTWFYCCQLRVDGDAGKTHRLSENTVVKINGKTCPISSLTIEDNYCYCYVDWPEVTITGKLDDRTEVTLIEATSPDYMTIPAVGTSVNTKPTVSITTGTQARFDVESGYWAKQIYQGGFTPVTSGEFSEGTWDYSCYIWIDGNAGKSYRLSENLVVKLNGLTCKVADIVIVDKDYSRVHVRLPVIEVKKQGTRTEITLVEATSTDYATIPVVGTSVETQPTVQITTGAPAYFATYMGDWMKKTGANSSSQVTEGLFTEGTWFYKCQLRVDGDAGKTHRLSENTVVKINGKTCQISSLTIEDNYSCCYVDWPEVTIAEAQSGTLGTQGKWEIKDGVLTIDYDGDMPQDVTLKTTDPNQAYRLVFEPLLSKFTEVVIRGHDVGVQPYLFYFSGDGPDGTHPDDKITKITISSDVKRIGKQAFVAYNLKHFYSYCEYPPTLSSDNGGSNVFWKSRITANLTQLHLLNKSGVRANYGRTNTEWVNFPVINNDLDPANDPTGILLPTTSPTTTVDESWYTLDGRLMRGKPSLPGMYINNGKKVVIR